MSELATPLNTAPARDRHLSSWVLYSTLVVACAATALWPSDAPFINDDPMLIANALRANQEHRLATGGLVGSHGFRYGPLPTWIYQGILLITHDLPALIAIRAVLCNAVIAVSLLSIARQLKLPSWFTLVAVLSPYTWLYSRQLWDNSFGIPLTAASMAVYVRYLLRRDAISLFGFVALCAAMTLVHVMSMPLIVAMVGHALITTWRDLLRLWWVLGAALLVVAVAMFPYIRTLLTDSKHEPNNPTGPAGWWFPLLGARILGAAHLKYFLGERFFNTTGLLLLATNAAICITFLAYLLSWIGMLIAAWRGAKVIVRRRTHELLDHIAVISLSALVLQIVLDGVRHVYGHPHYYNGTWIIFVIFPWLALNELTKFKAALWIIGVQITATMFITAFIALRLHERQGVRTIRYGPSLGQRIAVVDSLHRAGLSGPFVFVPVDSLLPAASRIPEGTVVPTDVRIFMRFPHGLNVIEALNPSGASTTSVQVPMLVRWASSDVDRAHVEAVPVGN